ncbi:hypothetical protein ACHAW5_001673 [Stephanodiscus triporus]|uniref:Uncharacterized protein n=1 Tax=Stephanodiscus triporus TaxID=2934178 RepID=A0ABD3Q7J2_9STRA
MTSIRTLILCCLASTLAPVDAFAVYPSRSAASCPRRSRPTPTTSSSSSSSSSSFARPLRLDAAVVPDLGIVGLVAGQENYGLAIVAMGEALWSFAQSPSLSHARVLVPASLAAATLFALSGPMITSGDVGTVALGLEIATGVSVLLGARCEVISYVARLVAPTLPREGGGIAFMDCLNRRRRRTRGDEKAVMMEIRRRSGCLLFEA